MPFTNPVCSFKFNNCKTGHIYWEYEGTLNYKEMILKLKIVKNP